MKPRWRARARASTPSRDLPMPASPASSSAPPDPAAARSSAASTRPSSSDRPTSGTTVEPATARPYRRRSDGRAVVGRLENRSPIRPLSAPARGPSHGGSCRAVTAGTAAAAAAGHPGLVPMAASPCAARAGRPARGARRSVRRAQLQAGPADTTGMSSGQPQTGGAGAAGRSRWMPVAWQGYLLAAGGVAVAYYATGSDVARLLLYNGLGLSSVVAMLVGMRRYRPQERAPWMLF